MFAVVYIVDLFDTHYIKSKVKKNVMAKWQLYKVIKGRLIFNRHKKPGRKRKVIVTEAELKDLNLARLIIRRSRPRV
jgi:hypothetical protein